ncbi:BspA family leucine-rich repeat surface protein [Bombilactobacillus bombi]|uniref:BspA family leucine-rich repeat surface protein n=1 Tax=Bombilactobacillus bombi TaxID=1303590 RepID=UPI0035E67696
MAHGIIDLNPDEQSKVGAVTLNTLIDVSKDFHFSWKIKISAKSIPADGIGFVMHPIYKPGQLIDPNSSSGKTFPNIFGRHSDGTAVTDPGDSYNGQTIHSLGVAGGNLGIGDLMNAIGFKIDTYHNDVNGNYGTNITSEEGTYYGSTSHDKAVVYGTPDPKSLKKPFGAFVTTDSTGYSTIDQHTMNLSNIVNNDWWQMDIKKNGNTLSVTLSNPNNSFGVTIEKDVTAFSSSLDHKYAFAIVSSTGLYSENNQIKDISGQFTPAEPTLITRYTDENGTDIKKAKVLSLSENDNKEDFIDVNDAPNIKNYRLAQVNGTVYNNSTKKFVQLKYGESNFDGKRVSVTKNTEAMVVKSQFNNLLVLDYDYRRVQSETNSDITTDLKIKVNNGSYGESSIISPNDIVTFKYSVTNKTGPKLWKGVTAVQSLAGLFEPVNDPNGSLPAGLEKKDGFLYIPLLKDGSNNLAIGNTCSSEISFIYQGAQNAKVGTQDNGQVTIDLFSPNDSQPIPQEIITSRVSIYDKSDQLINSDGKQMYGSYFYISDNHNSPLHDLDPSNDKYELRNYVPSTPAVKLTEQIWWTISKGILTIYPHNIDINATSSENWPWNSSRKNINSVVIKPNVRASGSIDYMFADMVNLKNIDGLNNLQTGSVTTMKSIFKNDINLLQIDLSGIDMTKVTDTSTMFSGDSKLWKIKLGPKNQFPYINNDLPFISAPGNDTLFPENNNYSSRDVNWREVDQGTDYSPKGSVLSAIGLSNYHGDGKTTHIYVWNPSLTGYLTLMEVPENLDYGIHVKENSQILETQDRQRFIVLDTRSLRNGLYWFVTMSAGKIANIDNHQLLSNPLEFDNQPIDQEMLLHSSVSTDDTRYVWSYDASNGIKLNIKNNTVPSSGKYNGTITYTLVDGPN